MLIESLKIGDTLGIIAPSGCADFKNILWAAEKLKSLGFKLKFGESCHSAWFKFAGTDTVRANDINRFFEDKEVDGILCLRGGYGAIRILDLIDYTIIKNNPKIFVGFSDITNLHAAFNKKAGLVTFHGPMLTSNFGSTFNEVSFQNFLEVLTGDSEETLLKNPEPLKTLFSGKAQGRIIGGNLITLGAILGSEYDYDYTDAILFIEEIGETSYKIDRVLGQMKLLGVLSKLKGVILGDFNNCEKDSEKDMDILGTFADYFRPLNIPVIYNYKSGHCEPMMTLPLGAMGEIDTESNTVRILEKYKI
ncbi:MAG: S66 peptidase family protein [Fusobacteriaceae bacterium]